MDTTKSNPQAICLDLTRLLSRVGRPVWTGIDRVERAYLEAFLKRAGPLFALVATKRGYFLFDRQGVELLHARLVGAADWGRNSIMSAARLKLAAERRRAEADLARLAIGRARKGKLGETTGKMLPGGTIYFNVGHSNLTAESLGDLKAACRGRTLVFVHDTIPLDHPQWQRPGTPERFRANLQAVSAHADLILCNSAHTRESLLRHFALGGATKRVQVAHLGVNVPAPVEVLGLPGLDMKSPYFVTVGTIEPRKNHAFLLDLWDRLRQGNDTPQLVVAGQRGWAGDTLFARMEGAYPNVLEFNALSDSQIAGLVSQSAGLVMPSLAEGFGLPVAEAAMLGAPVLCNDLPVYREYVGDYAIYADVSDLYSWETKLKELADKFRHRKGRGNEQAQRLRLPTWQAHFDQVFALI